MSYTHEQIVHCPTHRQPMQKMQTRLPNGMTVTLDVCAFDCTFLDAGERDLLMAGASHGVPQHVHHRADQVHQHRQAGGYGLPSGLSHQQRRPSRTHLFGSSWGTSS